MAERLTCRWIRRTTRNQRVSATTLILASLLFGAAMQSSPTPPVTISSPITLVEVATGVAAATLISTEPKSEMLSPYKEHIASSTPSRTASVASSPSPVDPFPGLYNLAQIPWHGRRYFVSFVGSFPMQVDHKKEPASGLREILGYALGRANLWFQETSITSATEPPDIIIVGEGASVASIFDGPGRRALVLLCASRTDGVEAGDGTFFVVPNHTFAVNPDHSGVDSSRDVLRLLPTTLDQLDSLLNGPARCGEGILPAEQPGRMRGSSSDAWCNAARHSMLAAYITALRRGSVPATSRAVFSTFGTTPGYDRYVNREQGPLLEVVIPYYLCCRRLSLDFLLPLQDPSSKLARRECLLSYTASRSEISTLLS
jgi:hypothetical protein